jgi:transposase
MATAPLTERERELEEEIRRLKAEREAQKKRVAELEQQNKELKAALARACRTSRNSSKRPSSDIVKPRRPDTACGKRKIGAQPGHPKHERKPFDEHEIDWFFHYELKGCPRCGGPVMQDTGVLPAVLQQVDIIAAPVLHTQHSGGWFWCAHCQELQCAIPPEVQKAGLCGPVITAWIAYLKGGCHASFSTIRKFLRDILGVRVCRGLLAKVIGKVSAALQDPWEELQLLLPLEEIINADETGHKENGRHLYTWCFRAREYILFKIAETRSTAVLLETLGADFNGVIGCDYFSSYRCYMKDFGGVLQFCLAHFIREVKFLLELPDELTRLWAQRLLDRLRGLFQSIHERDQCTALVFQTRLEAQRKEILRVAREWLPETKEANNLAKRLRLHGDSYFRFITTPGLEPTNNSVEQAIRFVVIDRLVTQGTRSETGRRWSERIWTVIATCTQQGRSTYHFIYDAIKAHFAGCAAPSLRPAPS